MSAEAERVYRPSSGAGIGFRIWAHLLRRLWDSRNLLWQLARRDVAVRYRQSVLGYAWALLGVAIPAVVFVWLNRANVLSSGALEMPYAAFVMLNLTVWQLFATTLTQATQSLVSASSLITKVQFPLEVLVLASAAQPLVDFVLRGFLLALTFALVGFVPHAGLMWLPLLCVPLLLLALAFGFMLSILNAAARDVGQIVALLLTFRMFLSPVLYPIDPSKAGLLRIANPVVAYLDAGYTLAARGTIDNRTTLAIVVAGSVFVFLLSWRVFVAASRRIAERI